MEPRELVRNWVAAFNRADAEAMAEFYTEDAINHQVIREPVVGRAAIREMFRHEFSGQEVPHYHFHVVPRQPGSDWGIGPPQLHKFPSAGRAPGTLHDPSSDDARRRRARVDAETLRKTAALIRNSLPG